MTIKNENGSLKSSLSTWSVCVCVCVQEVCVPTKAPHFFQIELPQPN